MLSDSGGFQESLSAAQELLCLNSARETAFSTHTSSLDEASKENLIFIRIFGEICDLASELPLPLLWSRRASKTPETEDPAAQEGLHASTFCSLLHLFHSIGKTDAVSIAIIVVIVIIIIIIIIIGVVTDSCSITKMAQLHKLKCTARNTPTNMPAMAVHEWILKEKMSVYIRTIIKHAGKSTKQKQKVLVGNAKEKHRKTRNVK